MSTSIKNKIILIESVSFDNENIIVKMSNGETISSPIATYPNLKKGKPDQLNNFSIEGNGRWIHWEELDEDLSADGFLK